MKTETEDEVLVDVLEALNTSGPLAGLTVDALEGVAGGRVDRWKLEDMLRVLEESGCVRWDYVVTLTRAGMVVVDQIRWRRAGRGWAVTGR